LQFPAVLPVLLGALGPSAVTGILVAARRWGRAIDKHAGAFFRQVFDPRVLSWRWHLVMVSPMLILARPIVLLVAGVLRQVGLFERGSDLFLSTGLVVGVFWASSHLPLFVIIGTTRKGSAW